MSELLSTRMKVAAVFVFMGFLMTIGMTAGTLLNPEGGQYHDATDPQTIIDDLVVADSGDISLRLAGIVFDTFFIIGYVGIFYGLYLLISEKDPFFSKLALGLGLITGFSDMIENAIHIALLNGIPAGWTPDGMYFAMLWSFTFVKDLTSYMAGMIFIVLLIVTLNDTPHIRTYKMVLAILLVLYVGLGSMAVIESTFLLFRNLSFVIDMFVGSIVLFRLSSIIDN